MWMEIESKVADKPKAVSEKKQSHPKVGEVLILCQPRPKVVGEMWAHIQSENKTKKCQPAAGDTPDLIQTECVTNSRLTHPNKNIVKTMMEIGLHIAEKLEN